MDLACNSSWWEGDAEIVWSSEFPNVPDWWGGGVAGGDGGSYLEPDSWGLVQNTLFVYLFKPAYILAASEKGHTCFGT